MLLEEALFSQLAEDGAVSAIVVDRVFPVEIPQFKKGVVTYPCLVYQLVSRSRISTHDGPTNVAESTIAVSCLAVDYMTAKRLADAARRALARIATIDPLAEVLVNFLGIDLQDESDNFDYDELEEMSVYHVRQVYFIRHVED